MAQIVTCNTLGTSLISWLRTASDLDKAKLCDALGCGGGIDAISLLSDCNGVPLTIGTFLATCQNMEDEVRDAVREALDIQIGGLVGYVEYADMIADTTRSAGTVGVVFMDPVAENNGYYLWDGTTWNKMNSPFSSLQEAIDALSAQLKNKVDKSDVFIQDTLFSVLSKTGEFTFLQANDVDGGPTVWSAYLIKEGVGLRERPMEGTLISINDSNGVATWLQANDVDGGPTAWSASLIKKALGLITTEDGEVYPQTFGTTQEILGTDLWRSPLTGEIQPILTDMTKLAGWGSSSMDRSQTPMAALAAEFGMTYHNGGVSGQATPQIAARIGSIPALVSFAGNVIPASGTNIPITVSNVPGHAAQDYMGSVAGVPGRLYYNSGARFDRTTAGDAVTVEPDTPFLSAAGGTNRAGVNVLWMGRNNLGGDEGQAEKCIADTDASFDWFSSFVLRHLVMGHFTGNLTPDSPVFQQILQVNAAHAKRYQNLYIDVQGYLSSPQLWTDTGLTPIAADLAAQAVGTTPPSALADTLHLTPLVYTTIVQKLVRQRMLDLGWVTV